MLTVSDGLQARVEGFDLRGRVRVDLAEQRLAEVGELGVWKASHEPLRPDDSHGDSAHVDRRPASLEDRDAGLDEHLDDLVPPVQVPVVVPEHRQHRNIDGTARFCEHPGLLGVAVRGQVAGQEHQVDVARQRGERGLEALTLGLAGVDVTRRGDPDSLSSVDAHGFMVPACARVHPD